jgi:hypothetical protein
MNAHLFDFEKQNQKNGHSFKIFLGGVSRQGSFELNSFSKVGVSPSGLLRQALGSFFRWLTGLRLARRPYRELIRAGWNIFQKCTGSFESGLRRS